MKKLKKRSGVVWLWCLHCRRAHSIKRKRLPSNLGPCPFHSCDGDVFDQIPWPCIWEYNPGFPKVPRSGEVYHPKPGVLVLGDDEVRFVVAWG